MFIQFPEVHTPIQGMENGHMLSELEKVENKESYK